MGTPLFFIITKNKKMKKFLSISLVAMLFAGALSSCDGNNPTPPDENLGDTIQVQTITADKEITLFVDSTYQIKVSITPENANEELVWSSDNEKVATVDQEGVVTAIAAGECKISVSIGAAKAITKVTVINQPVTLELSILSVEQDRCTIKMTPSDNKGYYFCTYTTPQEIEGLSEAEILERLFKFALAYADQLAANFGKTLTDILHSGPKSQVISGLKPNTEYVVLAFGVDAEHKIASPKLASLPFKTPEIEMSDMTIEIKLDSTQVTVSAANDTVVKLCFSATPSNDDPYICRGAVDFDEKYGSIQEYLDYLESKGIESKVVKGPQKIYGNDPKDGDVYTLIAAGYKGGWTTEPFVFRYEYKAASAHMPARFVPYKESTDNSTELNPLEIRPFVRKDCY